MLELRQQGWYGPITRHLAPMLALVGVLPLLFGCGGRPATSVHEESFDVVADPAAPLSDFKLALESRARRAGFEPKRCALSWGSFASPAPLNHSKVRVITENQEVLHEGMYSCGPPIVRIVDDDARIENIVFFLYQGGQWCISHPTGPECRSLSLESLHDSGQAEVGCYAVVEIRSDNNTSLEDLLSDLYTISDNYIIVQWLFGNGRLR